MRSLAGRYFRTKRLLPGLMVWAVGASMGVGSLAFTHAAFAQDADDDLSLGALLDLKVVSASKRPQKLSDAPATMYVVTEDDIRRYGFNDIKEVIKIIPGMETSDPSFFLFGGQRGFAGNFSQTLMLVDGREMQNLLAAESFISNQFRLHNVLRVEVIQGPASALYGANAFSGVINIITKTSDKSYEGTHVESMAGSFNTKSNGVSFAKKFGDTARIAGHASAYETDGEDFSSFINNESLYWIGNGDILKGAKPVPGTQPRYPYANPQVANTGGIRVDVDNFYAGTEFFQNKAAGGLEDAVHVNPTRQDERRLFTTFAGFNKDVGKATYSVEVNHTQEDIESQYTTNWVQDLLDADGNPVLGTDGNPVQVQLDHPGSVGNFAVKGSHRTRVIPQVNYDFSEDGSRVLIVGASYEVLKIGVPSSPSPNNLSPINDPNNIENASWDITKTGLLNQKKAGIYAQYQHGFNEMVTLTVGGRWDTHSIYGSVFNPRSGLVFKPEGLGTFKLLYGQAFREPNVFELSNNADAKPIKMKTVELSHQTAIGKNLTSQVVLYKNMATLFDSNAADAKKDVQGAELTFNYGFGRLKGMVNGSYVDVTKDETRPDITGKALNNTLAQTKANGTMSYETESGFTSAVVARGLSDVTLMGQSITGTPDEKDVAKSVVFDTNFSQRFSFDPKTKATISLSVKNLADTTYYNANNRASNPYQFVQGGRAFYVTGSADF
ncbi:MAG: hypothetical protein EOP06_00885 [Proteobacteria bacterium]|nr:MAG: hypothetical protein EOP06_00885 [Pseudomonadota bacterium]